MKKSSFMLFVFILLTNICFGTILNVPSEYASIQSAMNASSAGDTILVDEGTYYENIKFEGRSIVVASKFILDHNPDHITKTIINGSRATNSDSASCVMFYGEDENAVLQGFTLTEGRGTRYNLSDLTTTTRYDGMITIEGGGIFFNKSNATVKNNLIINNEVAGISGYQYNGGGGISSFCGNPFIYNNVIMNNRAISANGTLGYASGIVFNESYGVIRNNIVYHNITTAICAVFIDINRRAIIENNTIVGNILKGNGNGGINVQPNSRVRNNIVWGNRNTSKLIQFKNLENSTVDYCFTESAMDGYPTIFTDYPEFTDAGFMLSPESPCVDAGHPSPNYSDNQDELNPAKAMLPSLGDTLNDIGAYGGPHADVLPDFYHEDILFGRSMIRFNMKVNDTSLTDLPIRNISTQTLTLDSMVFPAGVSGIQQNIKHKNYMLKPMKLESIPIEIIPASGAQIDDWILIYHNGTELENPLKIRCVAEIEGPQSPSAINENSFTDKGFKVFPNPASEIINVIVPAELLDAKAQLYSITGKLVYSENVSKTQLSIDSSDILPGIYILKIQDSTERIILR